MKKNNKFGETILIIICVLVLIIYAILSKDKQFVLRLFVSFIIIASFLGIVFGSLFFLVLRDKIIVSKIKKNYEELKQKSERNIFEELYVLTFEQKADELLKQCLRQNKINEIQCISFVNTKNMKIFMYCKYKAFNIMALFDKESVEYGINSPSRYDGTKANINFEKLTKEGLLYEHFFNLDEFGNFIANLINKLKEKIDSFIDTNIVDLIFNGRLLDRLKPYLSYLKKEGLICTIFAPLLAVFMMCGLIFAFVDKNYKIENPAGFYTLIICCNAFIIFFIFAFIYGIKMLVRRANFYKDYKLKSLFCIYEFPIKVKINKEKPTKYSDTFFIKSVILYFNGVKLIIPFDSLAIKNKKNIKKCCEECKMIKSELKYLRRSKIIIDGEKPFIKIIKKHLL